MRLWNVCGYAGYVGMVLGLGTPPARAQQSPGTLKEPVAMEGRIDGRADGDGSNHQVTAWFVPNRGASAAGPSIQLMPADDATRAQLKLPDGRGLIVTAVPPAGAPGVQKDDILLLLDDTPLAKPEDLEARLKAAGEKTLRLELLHEGKPKTLTIRPLVIATFEEVRPEQPDYWIGVRVAPASPALRSQLGLKEIGLIATEVIKDGPAAKAGVRPHDLLFSLNNKALKDQDNLTGLVQKSAGEPIKLELYRGGKSLHLELTPEPRKVEKAQRANAEVIYQAVLGHPGMVWSQENANADWLLEATNPAQAGTTWHWSRPAAPALEPKLDALAAEVKELQKAVEELTKAIKDRK